MHGSRSTPRQGGAALGANGHTFALPGGPWWGGSTRKGNAIYLHILRWPAETITLPAIKPRIVLADEPTANLDRKTGEGILSLMKDINRHFGTTFIFSTHDAHIMREARRLVKILDGRVVDAGKGE